MKKSTPPQWALRFLQFYCKDRYIEQIEGDLYELFDRQGGGRKARWKFGFNTLRFFRLRYLKGLDDFEQLTTLAMIKNYLKVAIRTLIKQRTFAGINITGLAVGLASCLLILTYVFHEQSYDDFYPDIDRMYRVANGERGRWTPELLATTMMSDYPQVEYATRISGLWEYHITIKNQNFFQEKVGFADENVFNVFNMKFISGDAENALSEPNSLVLTESLAKKYFSNDSPIGQIVVLDGEDMVVSAVVEDPPRNTHFPFKMIGKVLDSEHASLNWTGNNYWTYAKIQKGVDPKEVNEKMLDLYEEYVGAELIEGSKYGTFKEFMEDNPGRIYGFTLHPVRDIHLETPYFSMGDAGNKRNVVVFTLVAFLILFIACINYINMSTARSAIRSKEVGIRKAMGSYRNNIIAQFLVESMLITLIAVILALIISGSSLNFFNQLTNRTFILSDLFTITSILSTVVLLIIVGLIAGIYPALSISGYSPISALRGQLKQAGKGGLRSGLVVFQFAISIFLIAATVVISRQVYFMQSQSLGIEVEQTLVIENGMQLDKKYNVFKKELEALSSVEVVSKGSGLPFHGYGDWTYTLPDEDDKRTSPYTGFVAPQFNDVLSIRMAEGRFFEPNRATDTAAVVINEALASELGWDEPIGKRFARTDQMIMTVIGVMKDFHFTSLKREIGPLIFRYGHDKSEVGEYHQSYIIAKINTSNVIKTLEKIESNWNQLVPEYTFNAFFLDDSYQKHYENEVKFGQIFGSFSGLAILIAFLGLFALTTFILQKRYKEIAVRKVLGASIPSLLRMMIRDFTRLVVIGGLVGISGAFYWLDDWLDGYTYRIDLAWYLFVLPIIMILILTWIVVSLKSYKAANANPVNALKDE